MKNEYGVELDRNGYAPSIIQRDLSCCAACGKANTKLDRHEIFHGANREKSKQYGLWIILCHDTCHLNGVHKHANIDRGWKKIAQRAAMQHYGWNKEDFIEIIGRNYI